MTERKRPYSDAIAVGTRWRRVLIAMAAAPIAAWCTGQTPSMTDAVSRTSTPGAIEGRLARRLDESESKPLIQPLREATTTPNAPRYHAVDHRPAAEIERRQANQTQANNMPTDRMLMRVAMANGSGAIETPPPAALPSSDRVEISAPSLNDTPLAIDDQLDSPDGEMAIDFPAGWDGKTFRSGEPTALTVGPTGATSVPSTPVASAIGSVLAIPGSGPNARGDSDVRGNATPPPDAAAPNALPTNIPPPISPGPWSNQLDPYWLRADGLPNRLSLLGVAQDTEPSAPLDVQVWWQDSVARPMGLSQQAMPIDLASVIQTALVSSPYVQGILTEPLIRQNEVVIADADFDSLAFIEAKFANTNEPVGSALTTGDASTRFRDETLSSSLGVRKKTRNGGSLELVQRGGFQDNNSTFLIPNPQGTSRLELNFTQPLLRNRGRAVNNTRVLLAQIDLQVSKSKVRDDLENHLLDVTGTYWDLYQARADWLQRSRLLEGAKKLYEILQARQGVDSHRRQVLRARAAVESRRSSLIRAEARVRNAQAQLKVLTGDLRLAQAASVELTPQDVPLSYPIEVSTRQATITALQQRNDIAASIREIQAVSARVGAARNQVLPRLDLILGTYVAGLDSGTDTFGAVWNQFSDGGASYAAGLLFEIPVANRANRARLARNQWEMKRVLYEFQQSTEVAFAEVEIAVRETRATFEEMATKKQSVVASENEVIYLHQRWELLPDPNESPVLLMEDLLDAQQRLADEERAFVQAQVAYAMSWVKLRKATGVLLRLDDNVEGLTP